MKGRPTPPPRYQATKRKETKGGYGVIEVWHDEMLDRDVAIKWLASDDGDNQLPNEWQMLSRALSRYVVEIYDLVLDGEGALHGIVMEYMDGKTLTEVDAPSNNDETAGLIRLLYQFAMGLADLHRRGIVHRDVKPDNAVIDGRGRLKICDFGISSDSSALTSRARGTMGYRAPEMFTKPSMVTLKNDVYSFGALCWRMFVGALPDVGPLGYPDSVYFPLPSIGTKAKVPRRLATTIDACLSWKPGERPSIEDVVLALRSELVKGKHVATISLGRGPSTMDSTNPGRKFSAGANAIQVRYDNYSFLVDDVVGDVYINNSTAKKGEVLTEGCVLTFGAPNLGSGRAFAPFRQFTPEVVI